MMASFAAGEWRPASELVGREAELRAVLTALTDPQVRAVVAHGPGGVGKTAVLRAALDAARARGALTGTGKYAEQVAGQNLDPIIAAVEAAVAAGLDQLYDPDAGLRDLTRMLGDSSHVFASVGGGLLRGLAATAAAAPVTVERADAQLGEALVKVLLWLEGFGVPILLMIDDWGRGGAQAQRICQRLVTDAGIIGVRLLASERDEESFGAELGAPIARVAIGPLAEAARLELASRALSERASAAADVLGFLGDAAARPFDLIESVRVLIGAEAIVQRGGAWSLDVGRAVPALAGAAAQSVVRSALAADPAAAAVAQLLAVHGDGALLADLVRASGLGEAVVRRALGGLADRGLVRWAGAAAEFSHDRLRAEVLLLIPVAARRRLAGALAEGLRAGDTAPGQGPRGMSLLWLRQEAGLQDAEGGWWRDAFTVGAVKARETGDRMAAERFVGSALQLAAAGAGETYSLLGEAAFAAITRGDDAQARQFADRMEMYSATAVERAAAQEMRVFARRASGDLDAALAVAREVLAKSGVKLPLRVTPASLAQAVLRVFMRNPRKAERPLDPAALALEAPLMRTINGMGSLLFERDPLMAVLLATSTLGPRIIYGTAAGAGTYSLMCCAFGDYRRAAAWAAASDRLQGPDQPLRAVAKQYSASFGHVFVRPRPLTRSRGDEMLALAYAGGDLAVAAYGNRDKVLDALFSDDPLAKTTELADEAIRVAERLGDAPTILHVRALRQCLEQLRCGDADGWRLDGAHFDLVALRARLQAEGLANAARAIAALEALLGVLFGRYSEVALIAERPWPRFAGAPFQAQTQLWTFATGLALYRTGKRPSRLALWNLRRLAQLNPNDFRHRERLLAAERARTAGRRRLAMKAYAEAVDAAALSRCLLEYGLVAAAAAEGAAALGAHSETGRWREVAINAWRELGAEALLAVRFGTAGSHVGEGHKAEGDEGQAAAERASRAKSRLLATVGHELRTPLQGAMGLVELAETGDEAVDLPSLRRVIHHLAGVVGDLTDLGALDGDVIAVRPEPVEVVDLIASVVALHRGEARAAGRSVLFDPPDAAMWVRLDARRLRQVVGNLLTNALRHGEGVVRVSLTSPAAGRLTVSVADEGPSIGAAERLRIFEPFDRGGRDADDGGLGVGLFLGRRLARAMGGDLTVRSLPLGKAFELETEAPAADIPVAEIAGGMAGLSVLLAEDTELSRQVLAALLRREGCRVVEAADGSEALAALAGRRFDLLLLDQRMPGASGLEVAAACAADDGPRPRIVLMTASGEDDLPALATQAGVDLLLQKPVSIEDLRRAARVAGSGPIGRLRVEELRAGLGPEADALLGQLRPTMEIELARLEAAVADGHSAEVAAQLHRLRGLAAHFGLDALAAVIPDGETADAGLANRLRTAAGRIDWSVLSRPR